MKPRYSCCRRHLPALIALAFAGAALIQPAAQAATITKAATGTDLTLGTSWAGTAPGASDAATWTSTSLGAGLTLASDLTWSQIVVTNASADIAISGTGKLTLSNSTGIDMSNAWANLSLANPIALGANSTWNVGFGKILTASGTVSESGGTRNLTKGGNSTLKLTNANSYAGTTSISAGTLNIQHAEALGTTVNAISETSGATLELQGGINVTAKTISLNGPGAVSGSGAAAEGDNSRSARAFGGALRNVSGSNTFGGTVSLGAATRIHSLADTLTLNSANAITGAFGLSVGGAGNTTISSYFSTAGTSLIKDGAGTLTLNSTTPNAFTGGVVLNNGTLAADFTGVGATANLLASGNALTMGGGTLIIKAKDNSTPASQTLGNVTVAPGASMSNTTAGSGGQILLNPNGSTGGTLTLGTLTATTAGGAMLLGQTAGSTGTAAITTTSSTLTNGIYSGRLVFSADGGTNVDWATTASSGPTDFAVSGLDISGNTMVDAATSDVLNTLTGTLTLVGAHTHNSLKLTDGAALNLGANTLTLTSGGLLAVGTTAATISGSAANAFPSTSELIVHQYNAGGLTISAIFGGTTLTKAGSGPLTLTAANTHTGNTYLNCGTLKLAHQNALKDSTVNMNGGTLTFDSSVTAKAFILKGLNSVNAGSGYDVALKNTADEAIALTLNGNSALYGVLSGSGSVIVASGQTSLFGNHTYTGTTTINSGATLNLGAARVFSTLSPSSSITVNGTGVLRLQSNSTTPLIQGTHFASNISGTGRVSYTGCAVILHGSNNYSGGSLFDQNNDGQIFFDNDTAFGSGLLTFSNNDFFGSVDATPHTLANALSFASPMNFGKGNKAYGGTGDLTFTGTVALGSSLRTLTVWDSTTVTFSNVVSGTGGGITKAGTGTLALAGTNSYTGDTAISAGTLQLKGGSLANTAISVTGSGTLAVQPGSATSITAGNTATAAAGATLNLGARTFDMTDGFVSTFNLVQEDTFAGTALTVTSGATFKFNLKNAGADHLAVTKAAAVTGTVNVTVDTTGASSLTAGTYQLITAASGLTSSTPTWQFTGGGTTQSVTVGTNTYDLTLSASNTAVSVTVVSTGGSAYDAWAGPYSLANPAFDFDSDNDGIPNGLEWILGGNPTHNDTPSIRPTVTGSVGGGLTLVFNRASASVPPETTLVVEWGSDLNPLANTLTIGTTDVGPSGNNPTIDIDAPTTGQVTVNIPAANAPGGKLFARLKAIQP